MAVTPTRLLASGVGGRRKLTITNIAMDDSYPTGGEAVAATVLGLTTVAGAVTQASGGYQAEYDVSNGKVILYYADYDASGDGPLIEVPNATDVSTVVVTIIAWGRN